MTVLQVNHHGGDESRIRQTNILGQSQHVLENSGRVFRSNVFKRPGQAPTDARHHGPARSEPETGRGGALVTADNRGPERTVARLASSSVPASDLGRGSS